jgi:2-haloacid dehalogenase
MPARLYQPTMEEVRWDGSFVKLDVLHRRMLITQAEIPAEKLDDKVADDLNLAWHRIDTWPDVVPASRGCRRSSCCRRARTATSR